MHGSAAELGYLYFTTQYIYIYNKLQLIYKKQCAYKIRIDDEEGSSYVKPKLVQTSSSSGLVKSVSRLGKSVFFVIGIRL